MAYLILIKICHVIYLIFNTIWYLLNINLFIANTDFFEKSYFEFQAAIFETYRPFFSNLAFSVVFGETLLPKCAYRPWDHFRFLVKR